jgi:hypothetical protein
LFKPNNNPPPSPKVICWVSNKAVFVSFARRTSNFHPRRGFASLPTRSATRGRIFSRSVSIPEGDLRFFGRVHDRDVRACGTGVSIPEEDSWVFGPAGWCPAVCTAKRLHPRRGFTGLRTGGMSETTTCGFASPSPEGIGGSSDTWRRVTLSPAPMGLHPPRGFAGLRTLVQDWTYNPETVPSPSPKGIRGSSDVKNGYLMCDVTIDVSIPEGDSRVFGPCWERVRYRPSLGSVSIPEGDSRVFGPPTICCGISARSWSPSPKGIRGSSDRLDVEFRLDSGFRVSIPEGDSRVFGPEDSRCESAVETPSPSPKGIRGSSDCYVAPTPEPLPTGLHPRRGFAGLRTRSLDWQLRPLPLVSIPEGESRVFGPGYQVSAGPKRPTVSIPKGDSRVFVRSTLQVLWLALRYLHPPSRILRLIPVNLACL